MAQDRFPYQAVIFDMDGVIVDTERFYFDQLDEMYTAAGMPVSHEELSRAVGASYKDFQKNLARWFAMGGVELSIEEAEARYDEWAKDHPADYASLLNPGVVETVAALKDRGVRVALASSSPMDNILHVLDVCGLSGAFELVTSGEQFHESKPIPRSTCTRSRRWGFPHRRAAASRTPCPASPLAKPPASRWLPSARSASASPRMQPM